MSCCIVLFRFWFLCPLIIEAHTTSSEKYIWVPQCLTLFLGLALLLFIVFIVCPCLFVVFFCHIEIFQREVRINTWMVIQVSSLLQTSAFTRFLASNVAAHPNHLENCRKLKTLLALAHQSVLNFSFVLHMGACEHVCAYAFSVCVLVFRVCVGMFVCDSIGRNYYFFNETLL